MPTETRSTSAKQQLAGNRWSLLLFLAAMFALAQPFDFQCSAQDAPDAQFNVSAREDGNLLRRIGLLGLVFFATASGLIRTDNRLRIRGLAGTATVVFLAWATLSIGWSIEPMITLRKVIVLGILFASALAAARVLTLDEILLLVLSSCGLALLLGVASELALGTFTPWRGSYRFAGVMLPAFSAWTASLLFFAALGLRERPHNRGVFLASICAAAVVLLLLTKTRASAAAFVAALAVYACLVWPPRRVAAGVIAGGFLLATALLIVELSYLDSTGTLANTANLGRETESISNFTGRADIWADLVPFVAARPLIGYGYESFWSERQLEAFAMSQEWAVPDSHNGFIELTLGIGAVGSALFVVILLAGIWNAWLDAHRSPHPVYTVAICALVITAVNAMFVATQLAPYISTFLTLVLLSRVAFVATPIEQAAPARRPLFDTPSTALVQA